MSSVSYTHLVPEWFEKWQKEKCDFQIHTEQEEKPLEEKVSCQEDSEPLMLDTEIKKSEKQKMCIRDRFILNLSKSI